MNTLPEELILLILSQYVPLIELSNCACVSRKWRRILHSKHAFRHYHNTRYVYLRSCDHPIEPGLISLCDLDVQDQWGQSPLHFAALTGNVELLQLIIHRIVAEHPWPADRLKLFDQTDAFGATPFYLAVTKSQIEVVSYLAGLGVNVNMQNSRGRAPIHAAAEVRNAALVRSLIRFSSHLDVIDQYEMTSLHIVANSAATPEDLDVVTALLEGGADPLAEDMFKQSPLLLAATNGHVSTFQEILDYATARKSAKRKSEGPDDIDPALASVQIQRRGTIIHPAMQADQFGNTCLHRACENGNICIVNILLCHACPNPNLPSSFLPIDPNARNASKGRTPLHLAARSKTLACVKALVEAGVHLDIEDFIGWTAFDHVAEASGSGKSECAAVLIKGGSRRRVPIWALPSMGVRRLLGT